MADRSKLYDKGKKDEPKKEAKSEEKAEEKKSEDEGKESEGAEVADEEKKGEDPFDLLKAMRERHRTEHRDMHGNQKAERDKMFARHDKEIREQLEKHMEGLKASPDTTSEEVAPAATPKEPVEE